MARRRMNQERPIRSQQFCITTTSTTLVLAIAVAIAFYVLGQERFLVLVEEWKNWIVTGVVAILFLGGFWTIYQILRGLDDNRSAIDRAAVRADLNHQEWEEAEARRLDSVSIMIMGPDGCATLPYEPLRCQLCFGELVHILEMFGLCQFDLLEVPTSSELNRTLRGDGKVLLVHVLAGKVRIVAKEIERRKTAAPIE